VEDWGEDEEIFDWNTVTGGQADGKFESLHFSSLSVGDMHDVMTYGRCLSIRGLCLPTGTPYSPHFNRAMKLLQKSFHVSDDYHHQSYVPPTCATHLSSA
jgi:hypothetical protein